MIDVFAFWRLKQNGNGRANANNNKSWQKSLIIADTLWSLPCKLQVEDSETKP
jgi:hypothetical protein